MPAHWINVNLFNTKLLKQQAHIIYTDPHYGMQDLGNFPHWNKLIITDDPDLKREQLVWKWELRSYFGLSFE